MHKLFSAVKYTSFTVVFLALFIVNLYNWQNAVLGAILLALFFLYYGTALGRAIVPHDTGLHRAWAGSFLLLSLVMLAGTVAYYVGSVNENVWAVVVILTAAFVYYAAIRHEREHDTLHSFDHKIPACVVLSIIMGMLLIIAGVSVITGAEITEAVRSPWEQIPSALFLPIFGVCLIVAALVSRGKERAWILPLVMATLFIFVSLAALVYPLGYGFDSFIHLTTVEHIAENGTITPKPFYYIGQYSAVLFFTQAFHLPIDIIDRMLLPLLTALLLPLAWFFAFVHLGDNKRAAIFSLLGLFFIPLSGFIVTTPQGLANLWTLIIILLTIPLLKDTKEVSLLALFVLGITALAIHPLAGIPILLYLALIATGPFAHLSPIPVISKSIFWIIAALGSVILPLVFVINAKISGLALHLDWASLSPARWFEGVNLELFFENRFSSILDFVYLYGFNTALILVILSLIGFLVYRRDLSKNFMVPIIMIVMLLINFLVMRTAVEFTFLIDYERANYSDRLIPLSLFFLVPFLGLFFLRLWQGLLDKPILLKAFAVTLIAALMTSAFYLTYPTKDNYVTSHGFNVGQSDINAVHSINKAGTDTDYIVLANQSVSAAAIGQFGFYKYYDDTFYYPVPTGDILYDHFLIMNESPDPEVALLAMDVAGVDRLFYVVNEYWWQAPRLIETAKRNADSWMVVDGGEIYVFEYLR